MRRAVREHNIYRWAANLLSDLTEIRIEAPRTRGSATAAMKRTRRATPHLFAEWECIARRIRGNKRLVVFLDFDGTLVRIAPMPDGVRLEDETREVLRKLAAHPNVTLAVISGRQRAELQHYIGVRNVKYMGLYGWESNGNEKLPFRSAWLWLARSSNYWRNSLRIPASGSNPSATASRST